MIIVVQPWWTLPLSVLLLVLNVRTLYVLRKLKKRRAGR